MEQILCPECSSDKVVKCGMINLSHRRKRQRYQCNDCGRTFREIINVGENL